MRLSLTLTLYIGRTYFLAYVAIVAAMSALLFVKDVVLYGHQALTRDAMTFDIIIQLATLKVPSAVQTLTPFALLAAGMYVIRRMTRHNELVAVRAAGVSAWQFLFPGIIVAFAIGIGMLAVVDPISADSLVLHRQLKREYVDSRERVLEVSSVGVWLRESRGDGGLTVIHADRARSDGEDISLMRATVLNFDRQRRLVDRIDAAHAELRPGHWSMSDVIVNRPGEREARHEQFELATSLSVSRIRENRADPESVSFWHLPEFIELTEEAGVTSIRYRMRLQSLLSDPLLYVAMILISATFSLRLPRSGGTIPLVVAGLLSGYLFILVKFIMITLGNSAEIPVAVAAWTPAVVAFLAGLSALLYLEEG